MPSNLRQITMTLPRDLSDAEVERFVAVIEEPRDLALAALMLYAGLRVGEVAVLPPADITVPEEPEAPTRLRVVGKGRKERVAYLCREGYQPLAHYLQEHPRLIWRFPYSATGLENPSR